MLSAQVKYRMVNAIGVLHKIGGFLNLHFQADKLPQGYQKMAGL